MIKKIFLPVLALIILGGASSLHQKNSPNELVRFLKGNWHTFSYSVANGQPIEEQDYHETMVIKNDSTLTITAFEYLDGQDITRDMILVVGSDRVVMRQGSFEAVGHKEGNAYYLKGFHGEIEYRFRLYTLADKYVFHREVWNDGKITHIDMSYLLRKE